MIGPRRDATLTRMPEFVPPTPEQLAAHLDEHPPRPPSPWMARAPLIVMVVAIAAAVALGGAYAAILPWLVLLGVFVFLTVRIKQGRSLEHGATRAQELAMLRHYPEAMRRAWRLVPSVTRQPSLYVRCVALLSQSLQQVRAYDAAITGYDRLLEHLPREHPGAVQLRTFRAICALHADRLADADDTLRQLRGVIEPYAQGAVGAAFRLAELTQNVRTHHYTEALERADQLLDDLRPLGVEAGYGHALVALCHKEDRAQRDEASRRQQVDLWWRRATLLLPPAALVERYPELNRVREHA